MVTWRRIERASSKLAPVAAESNAGGQARDDQPSADRLKQVTDVAPIGIFQTDEWYKYIYTNPRWSEITGVGPDQAAGSALDSVIASELRSDLMGQLDLPGETGAELSYRFEIPRSDAKPRIAQMTAVAIPDRDGGRAGLIGIVADVTAEAEVEAAMSGARDTADTASRLKSDFLANMSHEIRTPMNGVIGMTDLLLETDLDPRQRDYAQTVRNSGEALLTIINDILDFSKVEAGMLTIAHDDFALRSVVDDVADLLASSAQSKGIELVGVVDASVPDVVRGDAGRLRQILMNLVDNAVKFTQSGEVVIRVSEHEVEGGPSMLRFEVRDTGDGIEPEKIGVIFQPFVQADPTTSREFGGTGLGLAITAQLVTLMGGDFGVTSRPGEGSTFWFTIPARATTWDACGSASVHAHLAGHSVLVVDDNASQRAVLSEHLVGWGMAVTAVDGSRTALAAMRDAAADGAPFAIALLDRCMPGMGGIELKDVIIADATPTTALVLMTDLAWRQHVDNPEAVGFCAVLSKPVHASNLKDCLYAALNVADGVAVQSAPQQETIAGSKVGRILLAEDNLVNREVAVAMLSWAGYQVDTVPDGVAAVEANRSQHYDLILMDCQMPELSGYEATAAIRAAEGTSGHTPIVAMTAGARSEDRDLCLASGMDSYLAKPVKKDDLLDLVAASMSHRPQVSDETPGGGAEATDAPVLDRAHFDEVCDLGHLYEENFVAELVGQFIYDSEWRIAELKCALEADKAPDVGRHAGVIQTSSAQLGGRRLAQACRVLRQRSAADRQSRDQGDFAEIEDAFEELRRELAQRVMAGGRPPRRRRRDDLAAVSSGDDGADGITVIDPTLVRSHPMGQRANNCILMAQDNPISQRIARAMFEKLGHEVDAVSDGEAAVAAAILRPYRAIFIDCNLPTRGGYQATDEIRRLKGASRRTPIIAITESLASAEKQRCETAGMDDLIATPFSLESIAEALTHWPRRRSASTDASDPEDVDSAVGPVRSLAPALNLNVLDQLERLGESAGEDLVGRLATQFLADAECRIAELRRAVADADSDAVSRSAHNLCGSSANLGASELSRLCSTFGADGGPGSSRDEQVLEEVESELERVRSAFEVRSLSR
jgi:PAS domain S-box-containing protein